MGKQLQPFQEVSPIILKGETIIKGGQWRESKLQEQIRDEGRELVGFRGIVYVFVSVAN